MGDMTNKEIMLKAFKKAKLNGYKRPDELYDFEPETDEQFVDDVFTDADDIDEKYLLPFIFIGLFFGHSFAKAFWGEDEMAVIKAGNHMIQRWQFHLQQMVLEEEPLKYLERFL